MALTSIGMISVPGIVGHGVVEADDVDVVEQLLVGMRFIELVLDLGFFFSRLYS